MALFVGIAVEYNEVNILKSMICGFVLGAISFQIFWGKIFPLLNCPLHLSLHLSITSRLLSAIRLKSDENETIFRRIGSIATIPASNIYAMDRLLSNVQIQVSPSVFLKDPESSELGQKILTGSIDLIDQVGLEPFTFRKLALAIQSTEGSIYRYFESKHKLLLYLTSWYWSWMEYRLVFGLANIPKPEIRLEKAINILTEKIEEDSSYSHINEVKLHHIVIAEATKSYLTKNVDQENQEGVFAAYKRLVGRVSEIILEINPQYKYPHMLVSTLIEGAQLQRYFAAHLPGLTDQVAGEDAITECYKSLVHRAILA